MTANRPRGIIVRDVGGGDIHISLRDESGKIFSVMTVPKVYLRLMLDSLETFADYCNTCNSFSCAMDICATIMCDSNPSCRNSPEVDLMHEMVVRVNQEDGSGEISAYLVTNDGHHIRDGKIEDFEQGMKEEDGGRDTVNNGPVPKKLDTDNLLADIKRMGG